MIIGLIEGRHDMPAEKYLVSAEEAKTMTPVEIGAIARNRADAIARELGEDGEMKIIATGLGQAVQMVATALAHGRSDECARAENYGDGHVRYAYVTWFHFNRETSRYEDETGKPIA